MRILCYVSEISEFLLKNMFVILLFFLLFYFAVLCSILLRIYVRLSKAIVEVTWCGRGAESVPHPESIRELAIEYAGWGQVLEDNNAS